MNTYYNENMQQVSKEEYIEVLKKEVVDANEKLKNKNLANGTIEFYQYLIEDNLKLIETL